MKTLSLPHPSTTSWVWKPSCLELRPTFPSIVQPLPLTSTHESACDPVNPDPSNRLPTILPPVVPSFTSMLSDVVAEMVLLRMMFRSLLSGLPPDTDSQFD